MRLLGRAREPASACCFACAHAVRSRSGWRQRRQRELDGRVGCSRGFQQRAEAARARPDGAWAARNLERLAKHELEHLLRRGARRGCDPSMAEAQAGVQRDHPLQLFDAERVRRERGHRLLQHRERAQHAFRREEGYRRERGRVQRGQLLVDRRQRGRGGLGLGALRLVLAHGTQREPRVAPTPARERWPPQEPTRRVSAPLDDSACAAAGQRLRSPASF